MKLRIVQIHAMKRRISAVSNENMLLNVFKKYQGGSVLGLHKKRKQFRLLLTIAGVLYLSAKHVHFD